MSIIIPCFNVEKTIVETLKSLESNNPELFEVIAINDGSLDETEKYINNYLLKSKFKIKYISQSNKGVSSARNKGIEAADGEYIMFLDADDLLAEKSINCFSTVLIRGEFDTLACYRTTNIKKISSFENLVDYAKEVTPLLLLKEYTFSKNRLGFTSFCYKKEILDKYNIRFTTNSKYGEDFEFATKYLAHANNAALIDKYYYFYRIIPKSVSRTICYSQTDAIHSAERAEKYLKELKHPFSYEFSKYMVPRAIFSCAHRFCKARDKDCFNRLFADYNVKGAARKLKNNRNADLKTKLACFVLLINKNLFFLLSKI